MREDGLADICAGDRLPCWNKEKEIISTRPSWFDFPRGLVTIPTIDLLTALLCVEMIPY